MKRTTVALGLAIIMIAAAFAGGCSREDSAERPLMEPGVATQDDSSGGLSAPSEEGVVTDKSASESYGSVGSVPSPGSPDSLIVRNASLQLRVEDADEAVVKVRAAVKANQGEISDLSVSGGDPDIYMSNSLTSPSPIYATVTIRVPAEKLDALTSSLVALGTVISQTENASDVTEQAIDMEARLKNLRAEEERLRALLNRTNKVSELLAVEAELSRVRGEIEAMDAQLTYLKRQAARATLVVTLAEPAPVTGSTSPWFGLREAVANGLRGALTVVEMLITAVIAMIPLLIVAGLIVAAILIPLRIRGRRRMSVANSEEAEQEDV